MKKEVTTMKMTTKKISLLLCFILIFSAAAPLLSVTAANTVGIKTLEDYIELTKNCKNDSWSKGKTVELLNDLDLSNSNFTPIPSFSGTFNGNGYTISGVNLVNKGSHQGLFRYIQEGGVVENLNVKGVITPSGTAKSIGGIAGELSGSVINCSFDGNISGKASVGGIAGYVNESGIIKSSRSYGNIVGSTYTGGIAGQNLGRIELCENNSAVNTTNTEEEKSIQDLTNINLEEITNKTELVDTNTDTGGIAGYTKGKIISCKNLADIGYKSIGYNTGGIAGRNAGYIADCENSGEIRGRKDIGGICGQAEPYVTLEYSESVIDDIKSTLKDIKGTVNGSIDSEDNSFYDSLNNINSVLGDITDRVGYLSDDVTDYANDVTSKTNDMTDRMHKALTKSPDVFDGLSTGINQMSDGLEDFKAAGDYISQSIDDLCDDLNGSITTDDKDKDKTNQNLSDALAYLRLSSKQLSRALYELEVAIDSMQTGAKQLDEAVKALNKALDERKKINDSFLEIADSLDTVIDAVIAANGSLEEIAKILSDLKNQGYLKNITSETIANLKALAANYKDIKQALTMIRDALTVLGDQTDIKAIKRALDNFSKAFSNLSKAFEKMQNVIGKFGISLDFDASSETIKKAIQAFKDGCSDLQDGAASLSDSVGKLNEIVKDLSAGGALELPSVSDSFNDNMDGLMNSIRSMQKEFTSLNDIFKDEKNKLSDNINDITDQLTLLSDIMTDAYDDSLDISKDDVYEDISEYDRSGDTRGKVETSKNTGAVSGDINVGGVVGSMAIEYDFDPEDDVSKSGKRSTKFTYKTKCVVRHCTNEAEVTSKKDYSGGIVGRMDLGSVLLSDNYGKVSATDGNYSGGIAGKSDTIIRSSAAKCELSGNDYIGGIAGEASKIINCQTLVYVSENGEYTGAIAGKAETGKLLKNYCVNDDLGGIDDINYDGIAEKTDVGTFARFVDSNFNKPVSFNLKFVADDKEVANLTYNYKDSIPDDEIPRVPEKKGYYGKWSDYDFKEVTHDAVIEAEYNRNMDILSSDAKRENGKSIILVCGAFDDSARVSASKLTGENAIDGYEVNISNVYTDSYTVRYLPLSDKKTSIYIDTGSGYKKVPSKAYGSYMEFNTSTPTFNLLEKEKNTLVIYVSAGIMILIVCAGAFIIIKKKKKIA